MVVGSVLCGPGLIPSFGIGRGPTTSYLFQYTLTHWCVSVSLLDLVKLTRLVTITSNNYKYTRNSNNVIIMICI